MKERLELDAAWARFWRFLSGPDDNGCVTWCGSRTQNGYGKFGFRGKVLAAHRWAYQQINGPVPAGLELDHLCRNRACVNVRHLEAVTHRENAIRGISGAVNAARERAKTHCPHGHPYSNENTRYYGANRQRICKACNRERLRALRAQRAA